MDRPQVTGWRTLFLRKKKSGPQGPLFSYQAATEVVEAVEAAAVVAVAALVDE